MPRIKNPNFVSPIETYAASVKDAVGNALAANAGQAVFTFDQVRDFLLTLPNAPARAAMTDGAIAEVMKLLKIEVIRE